jgi:hypothetical protein
MILEGTGGRHRILAVKPLAARGMRAAGETLPAAAGSLRVILARAFCAITVTSHSHKCEFSNKLKWPPTCY